MARMTSASIAPTADELSEIVLGFRACTLPKERWTHEAHLWTTLVHVREAGPDAALAAMRSGIDRYNRSLGNSTGYHDTLTITWVAIVAAYSAEREAEDTIVVARSLPADVGQRERPLRHYTRERMMSDAARAGWVPPDLEPLPIRFASLQGR
jgi:hypothetical protein